MCKLLLYFVTVAIPPHQQVFPVSLCGADRRRDRQVRSVYAAGTEVFVRAMYAESVRRC